MDPLSQGLLGAALAQSVARRGEQRLAALVGAAAGMAADLDVLIRSSADPLLSLEYHRHFTHSLLFVPLGALVVALVAWPLLRRRLQFGRLYLFAFMGYSLSGVLDAFTSYGTHLLWPLSDARTAWSLIAVVDPVFTLGLLVAVVWALVKQSPRAARVGLVFAALYLGLAGLQSQRAESALRELAAARAQVPDALLVKPTLGNLLLWRGVYRSGDRFFVDAIRVGWGAPRIYQGGTVPRADLPAWRAALGGESRAWRDVQRFARFSDGWLAPHPTLPAVIGDVRYSMQPDGRVPLWGIELDIERPDRHVRYRVFRDSSPAGRQRVWDMLWGRPVEKGAD